MEDRFETIPEASSDIDFLLAVGGDSLSLKRGHRTPPRLHYAYLMHILPILPVQ